MGKNRLNFIISKLLLIVIPVCLLIASMVYLNNRWGRIRDIRRQADALAVIKALQFYYQQYGVFPVSDDDDGGGWDKSNDQQKRLFLDTLISGGLLSLTPFDPKNDDSYYYQYQRFPSGAYGCARSFAVFQISRFEMQHKNIGSGWCEEINFTQLAPGGFTWMEFE